MMRIQHLSLIQLSQLIMHLLNAILYHQQHLSFVHMPLPAPVEPPAPNLHCMSHILRPPGEWWKVRCSAKSEAEPSVIWSEDEDEDGEYANFASVPEPQTFKQAMHS